MLDHMSADSSVDDAIDSADPGRAVWESRTIVRDLGGGEVMFGWWSREWIE